MASYQRKTTIPHSAIVLFNQANYLPAMPDLAI